MKSKIIMLASILLAFTLGIFFSFIYFNSKIESLNEDIISREINTLSMASTINAPCEKLENHTGWIIDNHDAFTVFWTTYSDNKMIAKLVVNNEFSSAVETFENTCSGT